MVSRIERGRLSEVGFSTLEAIASALEIRLDIIARWRGGDLDRMVNAKHAALAERAIAWLREEPGWEIRPEVSFNLAGERGVVDLLAWHAATRTLLVIELKTDIVDVGELLGTLDRKRRLAWRIAMSIGWKPDLVGVCLLLDEGRTNRRRVAAHGLTLRAALPDDGRRLRSWLATPSGSVAAVAFVPDRRVTSGRRTSANVQRVRVTTQACVKGPVELS